MLPRFRCFPRATRPAEAPQTLWLRPVRGFAMAAEPGTGPKRPPPPREVPCLIVQKGLVLQPGPDGPERIATASGGWLEAFDAFDRLVGNYRRIYVVDLEGVQKNEPQLDLWQELSREADLWIDGGVQLGDQAIDILVSGARRAVLSTAR